MPGESFVLDAVAALTPDDRAAHFAQVRAFIARIRERPEVFGSVVFELQREALVRHVDRDPTASLWLAWARSRELLDECEAIFNAGQGRHDGE